MAIPLVVLLSSLTVVSSSNELNNFIFDENKYEFIDLTHPFDNSTVYWPNVQNFVFVRQIKEEKDGSWYAANDFAAGEHGGTHIDAPYHFSKQGMHVGEISLDKLIVPLIIVDISSKVSENPDFVLRKADLDHMINDNFGKPCLIIFKFGWSKFFGDRNKYLGIKDGSNDLNFPGLSGEVADWLTTSYKNIVGIGVDVASVDPGSSKDYPVHKATACNGWYNIENVNLNQNIPESGCTALALPMKIAQGTGAPLRLVAICPKISH